MTVRHLLAPLLLVLPLAACDGTDRSAAPAASTASTSDGNTSLGRVVREATDKARQEMQSGNYTLHANGQPDAQITAEGELLIDGKRVDTTAAQQTQLLQYRQQIQAVALAGMDVGVAGANLGARAAGEALKGVFSGNTDGMEARINAEADRLKAQAQQICTQMPALLATQQALAASLPAFAPYAKMDQTDVDECGK